MNHSAVVTGIVLLLILLPLPSLGFMEERMEADEANTIFGLQGWNSLANAKWQISFPYTTQLANPGIAPGTAGKIESKLEFNRIDSPMTVLTAGGNATPLVAFDLVYGFGSVSGGRGIDTDTFIGPAGERLAFAQSTNTLSGRVKLYGLDLTVNGRRATDKDAGPWGFTAGLFHYEDDLRMKQGVQTVSVTFDGITFPPLGPFSPLQVLDTTYLFTWDVVKVGLVHRGTFRKGLSYSATVSLCPYVAYYGEGYWNLRAGTTPSDFRMQSPNFIHKATKGRGYDAQLEAGYAFSDTWEMTAGYRYLYLYAGDGTDTTYFADGSSYVSTLDWATVTRQGAYLGLLVRF